MTYNWILTNTWNGEHVAEFSTGHRISKDDAIKLCDGYYIGHVPPYDNHEDYRINGKDYYYDDLDLVMVE
jgi:hypothetical protein